MDGRVPGEEHVVDDRGSSGSPLSTAVSEDSLSVLQETCYYCGVDDPQCLAKCKACSRWFCNGKRGTSGSHIVLHLVKAKHREVSLHKDNTLGESPLECYVCQSGDVFSLGYMPSKEDSVVILVCRDSCLHSKVLRDQNWDASTWLPLIEERQLLTWLCTIPNSLTKEITMSDIQLLEDNWESKHSKEKQSEEVPKEKLEPIPLRFESGEKYIEIFKALLKADMEVSKNMKEQSIFDNVPCRGKKGVGNRYMFMLKPPLSESLSVNRGDTAFISLKGGSSLSGIITEINKPGGTEEEIVVLVGSGDSEDADEECCVASTKVIEEFLSASTVQFRLGFNTVPFDRKCKALINMEYGTNTMSAYLYYTILGHAEEAANRFAEVEIDMPTKLISDLNFSQKNAIRSALKNPLTLIQGPPGTGKTSTSVAIVYHLYHGHRSQILVCSPSNVAADHLAERISETRLKVIRLGARYRQSPSHVVERLGLQEQVDAYIETRDDLSQVKKLHMLLKVAGTFKKKDENLYKEEVRKIEQLLLSNADVICCTCVGAGDPRLKGMRFKYVLVDEATQGMEPEILIPLVSGAKQVILVGDHCQLGPVITSKEASAARLGQSMFERLLNLGHKPLLLDVQYRMHPCLSLFPSNYFYEGTLQNGLTENQRDSSTVFPWPNPSKPIFFYNTTKPEEIGANGTSYLNRAEAALTEQIVTRLIQEGSVDASGIGVITPYASQRLYVKNFFSRCGALSAAEYDRVEVSSVDGFQGREKEFIILSCVRSNNQQGIGFVSDWRRLNVSLTRAKRGLIILGNVRLLSRYTAWHAFLEHLLSQSLIVDGPIKELVSSSVILQKPCERDEEADKKMATTPPVAARV